METNGNKIGNNGKIGKVLKKLLDPKFKIQNDVCLNQLLLHFAEKDDEKASQHDNNIQLKIQLCEWIVEASALWVKQTEKPQPAILVFALNLTSQLSTYEQVFVKLNCRNVYERLVALVQLYLSNDPTVTLGLVTLLCSFLGHKSGVQWIMSTSHWEDVINLGLNSRILDIRKRAYYFVQKLLENTVSFNLSFSINVVIILVKPLKDGLRSLPTIRNQNWQTNNGELYESLKPSLDFILGVTDPLLRNFSRSVLQLFVKAEVPLIINTYLLTSCNEDFSFALLQIQFIFLFHNLSGKVPGSKVVVSNCRVLWDCKLMYDLIEHEMAQCNVRCIIKICNYAHDLFCSLAHRMPIFIKNESTIEFETQMVYLQLTPIFAFTMGLMPWEKVVDLYINDIIRSYYILRWLKKSVVRGIEMSFKFNEKLKCKPDLIDDVVFYFEYIGKTKKLLNKERAAVIFTPVVYSFSDALATLTERPVLEVSSSTKKYFYGIMETIVDFVESFDLTWTDCVETINVMGLVCDFLNLPYWTNENMIIQAGLKLLKVAISKSMSPHMALLVYNKEDSRISETANLIYTKCHDRYWKIRESALEVVHILSLNANTKFPGYTDILLNAELPQLVVDMAFKDDEYYVRATAFRCLHELIQIQEVWSIILETDHKFFVQLLDTLENETEGVVRKETASLIHKIAKYQSFPKKILPRLYDVMIHSTIEDLHWEVKYTALDFWFNKWDELLIEQGMIDRAFPSHTFSKELKKIVALTPNEVKKRIIKVLHQLANIGCLHVMKCAVKDDCDFEVSKKATEFMFIMLRMFKVYGICCDNIDLSQPPSPVIQPNATAPIIPSQSETEPITSISKDSSSDNDTGSDPYKNLGSPQFSVLSLFSPNDLYSPSWSQINSPSSEILQLLSDEPKQDGSPLQDQFPYGNTEYQHLAQDSSYTPSPTENTNTYSPIYSASPIQTTQYTTLTGNSHSQARRSLSTNSSATLSGHSYSMSNPDENLKIDLDMLEFNDVDLDGTHLESLITNDTTQSKTSTYLAPSEFMKFLYNELETYATQKAQCMDNLDKLDSLLDDILTKYIIGDLNSID